MFSPKLQIGVNPPSLVEPPTLHELLQYYCLQRLQPEVNEEDWDRDMGLQEEEDCSNTNWEWRKKIAATDQLSNNSFSKP